MSTNDILRQIARGMDRPERLVYVPEAILSTLLSLAGKRALAQRLIESLHVDIGPTQEILDWAPPVDVETAFRETVKHIRDSRS